ncbi:membrane protein insertase YidC [Coraliomargarita parva]|uniref:membrane protein insertase YidC n=1 Tax=Coraliomargarita parva TaxID=3014050 RepID=UPI0022B3BCFC|nr:membrane protein insertase YidC [Coraliomargarita parva]
MDKKNLILGIACICAGLGVMFWQAKNMQETTPAPASESLESPTIEADVSSETGTSAPAVASSDSAEAAEDLLVGELQDERPEPADLTPEQTLKLANAYIEVEFTTRGGAIKDVAFLQTNRGGRDDYIFNQGTELPALGLSVKRADGKMVRLAGDYHVVAQDSHSVTFEGKIRDGLLIRRSYRLATEEAEHDPYVIKHSTVFVNESDSDIPLKSVYFNLGTAQPISAKQLPNFLNVGHYDGEDAEFVAINKLTGSKGFLGMGARGPQDEIIETGNYEWTSVKNQFFASVLSSDLYADEVVIHLVYPDSAEHPDAYPGITANVAYEVGLVPGGSSRGLDYELFIGPKEFKRLQALGNEQDLVMQFGKFFGIFSKLLLSLMYAIHAVVPSWGWSIIIMTVLVKLLFWPLTAKASKSQKRMAKIQEPMAALKEKYKDNPQKIQQETMKLFREHRVNPVAGCLPMFIQMPIFLGLFYMLRSASELRHEPFLWVPDLSQAHTVFEIAGLPINPLPLIMGVTMFLQMQMMPVSPTADAAQQKIFKLMPFVFLIFLYNFASGLVVYWITQNILTIIQQKITNSRPDEPLPAAAPAAKAGKTRSKK